MTKAQLIARLNKFKQAYNKHLKTAIEKHGIFSHQAALWGCKLHVILRVLHDVKSLKVEEPA